MKTYRLDNFTRGWIVGDFDPAIIKTKDFEVMVRHYKAGEKEAKHEHRIADEITVVVYGAITMNGIAYSKDDIIHLYPGDATDFECVEDCATTVIKIPSVMGDKYLVD